MNILITLGRAPGSLELSRWLGRYNHNVYVVDCVFAQLTRFSNTVKNNYLVNSPTTNTKEYIDKINSIIELNDIDFLIPCYEETFYISMYKESIKCNVFCSDIGKLKKLHSKYEFVEYLKVLNIESPQTVVVRSYDDFKLLKLATSVILKPEYSRYGEFIKTADTIKESDFDGRNWIVQEKIEGIEFCTYSICVDGKIIANSVYKKDASYSNVSVRFDEVKDDDIDKWLENIVNKTNFTGQVGFDLFKTIDGKILPCECNPRMTSGIHLVPKNKDLIELINKKEKVTSTDKNNRWLFFMNILSMGDYKRYSDVLYSKYDSKPFFIGAVICFFAGLVSSIIKGISISEATVIDIEWNGEE